MEKYRNSIGDDLGNLIGSQGVKLSVNIRFPGCEAECEYCSGGDTGAGNIDYYFDNHWLCSESLHYQSVI